MRKKRVVLLSGIFLVLVAAFFAYFFMRHSGGEILTVSQLKAKGNEVAEKRVEVRGRVKAGSIRWDNQILSFVLADMQEEVEVSYQGVVPEDFKPGVELEISGKYNAVGMLEAVTLNRKSSPLCSVCH